MSGKKDTIKVFLRIRPERNRRAYDQRFSVDHTFDNSVIQFHVDRRGEQDVVNHSVEDYRFTFDRVFEPKATQEDIFNMVAKDCVVSALDGFNSTIFAYGQTGSGKTYSITGGTESFNDRGIIPRTLSLIYEEVAKRTDYEFTVRISYLQIYNDKGQDLLNRGKDARTLDDLPVVTIHESDDDIVLKGLEAHTSSSVHEALNLLFLGDTNRLYCETPMNKTSSRSHCIFTVSLEARGHGTATVRRSKLNLVDLAGSERVSKTGVVGTVLTEAKYINLSLHFLEHVIVSLSEKKDHVPFRNSMMTMVLRDSLGGNCRTAMLATCYPTDDLFMESISTCRFAQRVAQIRQNAKLNEETDPAILVRKLRAEVAQLKEQLAFYKKGDQSDSDRALSSDELQRCQEIVSRYLDDSDPNSQISGIGGDLARILACFTIMKTMLKAGGKQLSVAQAVTALGGRVGGPSSSAGAPPSSSGGGSGGGNPEAERKLLAQVEALTVSLQQKENELSLLFGIVEKHNAPRFNAVTQTGMDDGGTTVLPRIGPSPPMAERSVANSNDSAMSFMSRGAAQANNAPRAMPSNLSAAQAQVAQEFLQRQEDLKESYDLNALTDAEMLKDRAAAFEAFRRSYRKFEQVEKNKQDLKGRYDRCKGIAEQVNGHVDAIKKIKVRITQLRAERALQGSSEPDTDETQLMGQLDANKAQYSALTKELAKEKEQVDHIHLIMMRAQEQLAKDFEDWFSLRQKQVLLAQQQSAMQSSQQYSSVPAPPMAVAVQSSVPSFPPIGNGAVRQQEPTRAPASSGGLPSAISSSVISQINASQQQRTTVSSAPVEAPRPAAYSAGSGATAAFSSSQRINPSISAYGVAPPPLVPTVGNFVSEQHQRNLAEHAAHNRVMDNIEVSRNPYAPSYPSTGDASADAQLAQMYKAREEMRMKLLGK